MEGETGRKIARTIVKVSSGGLGPKISLAREAREGS